MDNEIRKQRTVPVNELDLNYLVIQTKWGSDDLNQSLKEHLLKKKAKLIPKGVEYIDSTGEKRVSDGKALYIEERELWGLLEYYTQDLRLGNLNSLTGETAYCQYYLNLAGDLLNEGYKESFIIALSRVASVLELSQSKNGFLRKNLTTFRHKQSISQEEKPKRNLFGMSKKNKQYEDD